MYKNTLQSKIKEQEEKIMNMKEHSYQQDKIIEELVSEIKSLKRAVETKEPWSKQATDQQTHQDYKV